jgi:glycosyltransferase involved in cell wall biosynthesis
MPVSTRDLTFLVPGSLDTPTGGYAYDRRIIDGLRRRGWRVDVPPMEGSFPFPTDAARRAAQDALAAVPDDRLVLVDGLAFGALPDEAALHARRLRLVALVHHPLGAETGLDPAAAAALEQSERRALAHARHVVVTSDATAQMLEAFAVTRNRVSVVNPGTDPAEEARGSGGSAVHLLCVATLIPRKGHALLIRALASLRDLPWVLRCVGSADRDETTAGELQRLIVQEQLADRMTLAGERSGDALAAEYHTTDVFVLPTLYEGYGMVVAEALARGLPVVATRTGAIASLVDEDSGLVVPPGDVHALAEALSQIIADSAVRARLTAGARRARRRLPTWEHAASQMAGVLERVAQ